MFRTKNYILLRAVLPLIFLASIGCKKDSDSADTDFASSAPTVIAGAQVQSDGSASSLPTYDEALDIVGAQLDLASPDVGGDQLSLTAVKADGLTVSFAKATDKKAKQSDLAYCVYVSTSGNLETIAAIEANGTAVTSFVKDIERYVITSALLPATRYYVNVIVKDPSGNRSSYQQASTTTGRFPIVSGGGGLVAAHNGADVRLQWDPATNGDGTPANLKYGLFVSTSDNLTSLDDVLANGTLVGNLATDVDEGELADPGTAVRRYFNVVVQDVAGNMTAYTSVSFDTDANVHIAYTDQTNRNVQYVHKKFGSWQTPVVVNDPGDAYLYGTSIAVDAAGKAHVGYTLSTGIDLYYANNTSGSFVNEAVASSGNVGLYANLLFDTESQPFLIAMNNTTTDLIFYFKFAGSWSEQTAYAHANNVGSYANALIDANDRLHVVHYNATTFDLLYSTNASGAWTTEVVESTGTVGQFPSIGLDAAGKVHISHYSATNLRLRYVTNASGSWVAEMPDNSGSSGQYSSLAVGSDGAIHIAYYSLFNTNLRYLVKRDGVWSAPVDVDGATSTTGTYANSLKLDRLDRPYIAYHDDTSNVLKSAFLPTPAGVWQIEIADPGSGTDVGRYASLAIE